MKDITAERLAAWVLATAPSPHPRERLEAVRARGSCRDALASQKDRIPASALRAAERSFRRAEALGHRIIALTEPDYPTLLGRIADPPLALSVWGELVPDDALGIAVVGSRRATAYGLRVAHRLGRELAASGLSVVSGLARGIDAAAHRGALEASGRTLAVLGSGLQSLYPREHRRLAEAIAAEGAVLSEFDLDEPPRARNFPRRNRVITGLALGTLVVEATVKSGSLVSARHALEQNREVFAVPGPITSSTSGGVHALLRDGARLVTGAADVLDELRPEVRELLRGRTESPAAETATSEIDPDAQIVLERLAGCEGALDADALVDQTALPIGRALAALTRLEVEGHVVSLPGGLYRSRI